MYLSKNDGRQKIKVLYIFVALPIWGTEQVLVIELEGLDKKHFAPMIRVISEKGPIAALIEQMGFQIIHLRSMRKNWFGYDIIQDLKTIIIRKQVTVVRTHIYNSGKYGRKLADQQGCR
jgi:hypothetical protein